MKKLLIIIGIFLMLSSSVISQAPQSFKYQAIARDIEGNIISNKQISLRISLLQGSRTGQTVYSEIHDLQTTQYGLVLLEIGNGKQKDGEFSEIDWGNDNYYVSIEIDNNGGTDYESMGSSQLLSVPYALYAEKSGCQSESETKEAGSWTEGSGVTYLTNPNNVGIGTTLPASKLHVNSGGINAVYERNISTAAGPANRFYKSRGSESSKTQVQSGDNMGQFQFWGMGDDGSYNIGATLKAVAEGTRTGTNLFDVAGSLQFLTTNTSFEWGERMRISPDGDLGIGTTAPAEKLDVKGNVKADTMYAKAFSSNSPLLLQTDGTTRIYVDDATGNVGVGTVSPETSAALEINSTTKGLLPPKMTTAEMNAISNPAEGLNIYNTDVKAMCYYDGSEWNCMDVISLREKAFICGNVFIDYRDNKSYSTFMIGKQCWMAKNLAFLPSVSPSSAVSETSPYYYVYDYQGTNVNAAKATTNYQTYGVLYNWPAAMAGEASSGSVPSGVQGVCPSGWHLPSDEEWKILEGEADSQYGYPDQIWGGTSVWRGADAGQNLREAGTTHWTSPNTGATNSSGFTALPGGRLDPNGFAELGTYTEFWSSMRYSWGAWSRFLHYIDARVGRMYKGLGSGYSVRCIKDCSPWPTQADAGSDSLSVQGTSTTLNGNTPSDGSGLWSIVSGNGGSFADASDPATLFTGLIDSTYTLLWTISNSCGSTYDTVMIGFVHYNCGIITDSRDGITYNTVIIGTQCWMKENLAYLPAVSPSSAGSETTPHYYVYYYQGTDVNAAKVTTNYLTYGVLYNWPAAMAGEASSNSVPSGVQGVCPTGWHLPSDAELTQLTTYLGGESVAGGKMKEIGTTHWNSPNTGATNSSGFAALPAGLRYISGSFYSLGFNTVFWSSTENSSSIAWYRNLGHNDTKVYRSHDYKTNGFSCRCLKD